MRTGFFSICLAITVIVALTGCTAPQPTPLSDQAIQSTIQAAVESTVEAHQGQQTNVIEAAVQATLQASAASTANVPPPTSVPAPTLVPDTSAPAGQYETMSESELATYIKQIVIDAAAVTSTAAQAASQAAADQVVTQAEYDTLFAAVNDAMAAIFAAESAITAFYTQYGALAGETLALLQQMEQELAALNAAVVSLNEAVVAISAALQQGQAVAAATLTQLENAAQQAQSVFKNAQTQAQDWLASVQNNLDQRVKAVQAAQPNSVATTAIGALQNANQYLAAVRTALADQQVSPDDLAQISVISANATASLKAVGGAELQQLADSIATMTVQLAHGDLPQLKLSLSGLSTAPARP